MSQKTRNYTRSLTTPKRPTYYHGFFPSTDTAALCAAHVLALFALKRTRAGAKRSRPGAVGATRSHGRKCGALLLLWDMLSCLPHSRSALACEIHGKTVSRHGLAFVTEQLLARPRGLRRRQTERDQANPIIATGRLPNFLQEYLLGVTSVLP